MSSKKNKYIEKEAAHSGSDESEGFESDHSDDEYEKGSFVVSDDEASSSDDDNVQKKKSKKIKLEADKDRKQAKEIVKQLKEKVYKPHGNKSLDMKHVPPEPVASNIKVKPKANYHFSISFTNARFAEIFWNVAAKALPYLFFHLEVKEDYAGLRLEAHDTPPTMAIKSKMECIIEAGVDAEGKPIPRESIDGQYFCVKSKTLMNCFKCTTLKDTPLRLIKFHEQDGITCEASTDESDVKTSYVLPFYSKTPSTILSRINTVSDIQIKMNTNVLQKLAEIATSLGSVTMRFDLSTVENPKNDGITRNKLKVCFIGEEIQGSHTFFLSTRKRIIKEGIEEFEPIHEEDDSFSSSTKWKLLSSNSYSSSKFRLFVANLDVKWCMLGLSTEAKSKPVVIIADCNETGANKTSHAIFISPQHEENEN